MNLRYNRVSLKPRRRQLRKNSTHCEQLLWGEIRNRKLKYKFIRQYSVDGYVMDFYSPEARLGIEIEGEIHKFTKKYDKYREKYISAFWIKILKFKNDDIQNNITFVVETIKRNLDSPSI